MCRDHEFDDFKDCNTQPCPFWTDWGNWGACIAPDCMKNGRENKTRHCINGNPGDEGCEVFQKFSNIWYNMFDKGC